MQTQNISFKGYMPVEFYARHPRTGYYVPVLKKENIRKCQRFVINNLNNPNKLPSAKWQVIINMRFPNTLICLFNVITSTNCHYC